MLTIDNLRQFGVNVEEGLGRCMNNEMFYLRMVNMSLADKNFDILAKGVEDGDRKTSFEAAHALKGVLGNLSLTPLYEIVQVLTDQLRSETADVSGAKEMVVRLTKLKNDLNDLAK